MPQNLRINGVDYPNVPAITVPKTAGGSASFLDTTDATVLASDIATGKTAYARGGKIIGTGTGGSGGEYHVISTENSDGTQNLAITDAAGSISVEPMSITANGTYTAPDGSAYSPVSVNVTPQLQTKTIVSNGTYVPDTGYEGFSGVFVTVPTPGNPVKFYDYRNWDLANCRQYGTTTVDENWTNNIGTTGVSVGDLILLDITGKDSGGGDACYQNIIRVTSMDGIQAHGDVIAQVKKGEVLELTYSKQEQSKSQTVSANGTYTLTPDSGKVLNSAAVTVSVPTYDGTVI